MTLSACYYNIKLTFTITCTLFQLHLCKSSNDINQNPQLKPFGTYGF